MSDSDTALALLQWFASSEDLSRALTNEARLRELGWAEVRTSDAARWKEWKRGTESGYSTKLEDARTFEINLKIVWPEEGADFESLYEFFETEYANLVASVQEHLGTPAFASEFDEPPVPMPGQFDRASVWRSERGTVVVSFQHEDKEAPLRLSLWLWTPEAVLDGE